MIDKKFNINIRKEKEYEIKNFGYKSNFALSNIEY